MPPKKTLKPAPGLNSPEPSRPLPFHEEESSHDPTVSVESPRESIPLITRLMVSRFFFSHHVDVSCRLRRIHRSTFYPSLDSISPSHVPPRRTPPMLDQLIALLLALLLRNRPRAQLFAETAMMMTLAQASTITVPFSIFIATRKRDTTNDQPDSDVRIPMSLLATRLSTQLPFLSTHPL